MSEFLDRARLIVQGGNGGRGIISFRKEAHVPRGGPDGGDGGHGGDVILRVDPSLTTLVEFRYRRTQAAPSGDDGGGKNKSGKAGGDLILRVPPGTIITDRKTGAAVADLMHAGEELVVARGGRGGKGNARFVSACGGSRASPKTASGGTAASSTSSSSSLPTSAWSDSRTPASRHCLPR